MSLIVDIAGKETDSRYIELPSGLIVPEECAPAPRPKAIDLFSGCGGMSLGIIQAGFEVVAGFECEASAAITYLVNLGAYPCQLHFVEPPDRDRLEKALQKEYGFNRKRSVPRSQLIYESFACGSGWLSKAPAGTPGVSHFWFGDIRKVNGSEVLHILGMERGELDCVAGSPPCQGFTTSNSKRHTMDPRNSLVFEWARMVVELLPKTVIFENVPGMLQMVTPAGVPVVDELCRILEDGGFGCIDSFRKSLQAQLGIGFVRGKKKKPLTSGKRNGQRKRQNRQREKEGDHCQHPDQRTGKQGAPQHESRAVSAEVQGNQSRYRGAMSLGRWARR